MNDGKKLEAEVLNLLRASGKDAIQSEVLIGSKRCDLYFESNELGFRYRTAVECKDYSSPLKKSDVSAILAEYYDLFEDYIDRLLIVTRAGLNSGATRKVLDAKSVSHITIDEFERSILDFSQYVKFQSMEFREELASKVYVPCIGSSDGQGRIPNLHEFLKKQLLTGSEPTALIGGYGTGKTTTAKHLFLELADAHLNDPSQPIPVFVPLSRMTHEQSVQGLLGAIFTAEFQTPGYNYYLFKHLNKNRRLIIFLDGFDEMRQKLSWEEFVKILENLTELTSSNAQIVFSGRPTAFLTEDEYSLAIHGQAGDALSLGEGFTRFSEIEIVGFDEKAVLEFVDRTVEASEENDFTSRQRSRFLDAYHRRQHIQDLASRPVQLDMICKVIPMIEGDVGKITTVMIYDLFIKSLIDRDVRKSSRQSFNSEKRRNFSKEVAWWLWGQVATSTATAADIPTVILNKFKEVGDDRDSVLRDLVVGSFLTSRQGKEIFFPHRSIQEFLLAEHLFEAFQIDNDDREREVVEALEFVGGDQCNDEITAFVGQLVDGLVDTTEERARKYSGPFGANEVVRELNPIHRQISRIHGEISPRVAIVAARDYNSASNLLNIGRREAGHAHIAVILHWLTYAKVEKKLKEEVAEQVLDDLLKMHDFRDWRTFCVLVLSAIMEDEDPVRRFLALEENTFPGRYIRYESKSGKLNISALYKLISQEVRETAVISSWILGDSFRVESLNLPQRIWSFARNT